MLIGGRLLKKEWCWLVVQSRLVCSLHLPVEVVLHSLEALSEQIIKVCFGRMAVVASILDNDERTKVGILMSAQVLSLTVSAHDLLALIFDACCPLLILSFRWVLTAELAF